MTCGTCLIVDDHMYSPTNIELLNMCELKSFVANALPSKGRILGKWNLETILGLSESFMLTEYSFMQKLQCHGYLEYLALLSDPVKKDRHHS